MNLNNVRGSISNSDSNSNSIYNDIIKEEEKIIDMITYFNSYQNQWKNDKYLYNSNNDNNNDNNDNKYYDSYNNINSTIIDIVTNIHIDVVLLGFPSSAIEVIKDKWIDSSLGREDNLLSYYKDKTGQDHHILNPPGNVRIKHNFHLIQSSFHATDAIKNRIEKMLRLLNEHDDINNETNDIKAGPRYLNSWEVEELLEGLASTIASTHTENVYHSNQTKRKGPSATLFVLNLGSLGLPDDVQYNYQNGFSAYDLKQLAKDDEILDRAKAIITNEKRMTRLQLERNENPKSVSPLNRFRDSFTENGKDNDNDNVEDNNIVYWRDAIEETKTWAEAAASSTKQMDFTLRERALRIFKASKDTVFHGYKQTLAKLVIESSNVNSPDSVINPCSASTWIGSTRLMWTDLNAKGNAPMLGLDGIAMDSPRPRKLSDLEWLKLGADASIQVYSDNIIATRQAISRYLTSAKAMISDIKCKVLKPQGSTLEDNGANYILHWTQYLNKAISSKIIQPSCGILQMKIALLEATLDTSDNLEKIMGKASTMTSEEIIDDSIKIEKYIKDTTQLHQELLTSALEVSNLLIDETIHASRMSEQATVFLSHLAGFILHTTRYMISPPMERTIPTSHKFSIAKKSIFDYSVQSQKQYQGAHTDLYELVHKGLAATMNTFLQPKSFRDSENSIWRASLPNHLFPANVDITLYIVRLQSQYEPIATMKSMLSSEGCNSGFDFWIFMNELSRLKLPNQQMTISMEEIDSTSEVSLGLALASCVRYQIENGDDQSKLQQRSYLDSKCIWSHLQHYDEQSLAKSARKNSEFIATAYHLPIFLISVDDDVPTYLDGAAQAVNIGEAVIIVQNIHNTLPTGLKCGNKDILASGRNPIGPGLAAAASAIGGLPYSHIGHCGHATSPSLTKLLGDSAYKNLWNNNDENDSKRRSSRDLFDWSSFLGASPVFEAMTFSQPHFSLIDIDFIHRSRILHSLGVSRQLAFSNIDHLLKYADGADRQVQLDEVSRIEDHTNQVIADIMIALSTSNWASAASHANELYVLVHRQAEELEQVDPEDVLFSDVYQPKPSNNLLFYPMISGLLSFAGTLYYLLMFKKKKVKKPQDKKSSFQKFSLLFNKNDLPS